MNKDVSEKSSANYKFLHQDVDLARFFETAPAFMGVVELDGEKLTHIIDNHESVDLSGEIEHFRKARSTGESVTFEYRHEPVTLSVKVSFMANSLEGNPRFSYIGHDITEYKHELEIEKIPQIVWLADPKGHVYWYNEWFYTYTGLAKGEKSPIHPVDFEKFRLKWKRSLVTGEPVAGHFRIRRHDGEYRWHLSHGVAVREDDGQIIKWIGSNTDVHDNRLLLEKLVEEQEARERFVATLSHDLRTPLTAAKMSAQIIARKATDVDLVARSSARIVENMNRADVMIRDILDANRIKAGEKIALEFGHCNLHTLISDALDDLRTLHGDRFILKDGKVIEGSWSCNGIRRILENLCNNAIKYGSPQGTVTISLIDEDDHILLSVHNEGDPIPPGEMKKLFDPYRRAENAEVSKQRGWGLGLTLVKGIAEAHGGFVTVTSSAGEGTTFLVTLPKNID